MVANYPALWPIDPGCCSEWDSYDSDVQERARALASATLERLTAYRVTMRRVTVRPCRQGCSTPGWTYFSGGWMAPYLNTHGFWVNALCGCGAQGRRGCACSTACSVRLPGATGIESVQLNGELVDSADYRLDGEYLLHAGDGDCPWPLCQDLAAPDDAPGSFAVTYRFGVEPDSLAANACGVLACEYAKACSGKKCRLPDNVTSVSRQGVSYQIVSGAFPGGRTGIREIDAWLALWNPNALTQQPTVWSPDLR